MRRRCQWWLAAIVSIAAVVRFWGLRFGLPHTNTRPDEYFIIDNALAFLKGNLRPSFYDYPWLMMWIVAGLYWCYYAWGRATGVFHSLAEMVASWRVNWTPFFLIPRAASAVAGTATVLVVFRIARRLWGDTTGLIAALFMALAFLHVRDSHFGTTDVLMTCLLTLSVGLLIEAHESKRPRDFVVAGLVGGLAAATKYNALLLIVPLLVSHLIQIGESRGTEGTRRDARLFMYGVPFLITFAIGVPFLLFDLPKFVNEMKLLRQSMEIGSRGLELSVGWLHHIEYSLRYGLGLPLLIAGAAGMVLVLVADGPVGLVLMSFPIAYFIVVGSLRNLFFRYSLPMLPFICLAAARLVTRYVRRDVLAGAVAVLLVAPSAMSVVQFDRIVARTDNRVLVARWFDEHVPPGSTVLMSGSFYGYVQFSREGHYNAWVWDRGREMFITDLDKRPAAGRPDWILLQESPLPYETQPLVGQLLSSGYDRVKEFTAFSTTDPHVFDQQDAFFMAFAGFRGIERPGPNYVLYKRSTSAP